MTYIVTYLVKTSRRPYGILHRTKVVAQNDQHAMILARNAVAYRNGEIEAVDPLPTFSRMNRILANSSR